MSSTYSFTALSIMILEKKFPSLPNSAKSVTDVLNPRTQQDLYETSKLLSEIEKTHMIFFRL